MDDNTNSINVNSNEDDKILNATADEVLYDVVKILRKRIISEMSKAIREN